MFQSRKIHYLRYSRLRVRLLHFLIKFRGNETIDTAIRVHTLECVCVLHFEFFCHKAIVSYPFSRYFISRGKIVSKVAKYPHILDYRRAIQELDEKEYVSLWLVMCEVRNRYCSLHDLVIKNLEKIKRPRSSNAQSLY